MQQTSMTAGSEQAPPASRRLCTMCSEPISSARLLAKPSAQTCKECLERSGDVKPLRMHDGCVAVESQYAASFSKRLKNMWRLAYGDVEVEPASSDYHSISPTERG